jgi:hypothetical protein
MQDASKILYIKIQYTYTLTYKELSIFLTILLFYTMLTMYKSG